MRVLSFNGEAEGHFTYIVEAINAPSGGYSTDAVGRAFARALNKFDAVGVEIRDPATGRTSFRPRDDRNCYVSLEETEYKAVLDHVRGTRWVPASIRGGIAAEDWLANVPEAPAAA